MQTDCPWLSHLYYDEAKQGRRPGVLVFPEERRPRRRACKGRAERIAGLGYVALACDLHGDGRTYTQLEEVMPLLGPLMADPSRTRRAGGGLKALRARPQVASDKIASIGYCFGGAISLDALTGEDIAGVVGFHSGLGTAKPGETESVKPKILICIGAEDPLIPPDLRLTFEEEMTRAGADWQIHLYGGVTHSFTNPEADKVGKPEMLRYDRNADVALGVDARVSRRFSRADHAGRNAMRPTVPRIHSAKSTSGDRIARINLVVGRLCAPGAWRGDGEEGRVVRAGGAGTSGWRRSRQCTVALRHFR